MSIEGSRDVPLTRPAATLRSRRVDERAAQAYRRAQGDRRSSASTASSSAAVEPPRGWRHMAELDNPRPSDAPDGGDQDEPGVPGRSAAPVTRGERLVPMQVGTAVVYVAQVGEPE